MKSLPSLPRSAEYISADILGATNHDGGFADSLRKTDAVTLDRAGFALKMRDFEAYERDLPSQAWMLQRHAFFEAVLSYILTPDTFFELERYFPRMIQLATSCQDFEYLGKLIKKSNELIDEVQNCNLKLKAQDEKFNRKENLSKQKN